MRQQKKNPNQFSCRQKSRARKNRRVLLSWRTKPAVRREKKTSKRRGSRHRTTVESRRAPLLASQASVDVAFDIPIPASVVPIEGWDELAPIEIDRQLPAEVVVDRKSQADAQAAAVDAVAEPAVAPMTPTEVTAEPLSVAEEIQPVELFDAAGNLILPPAAEIAPAVAELTEVDVPAGPVAKPETAAPPDPFLALTGDAVAEASVGRGVPAAVSERGRADVGVELASAMSDDGVAEESLALPQPMRQDIQAISHASVVRWLLWPFRALYWPFRLWALHRQRLSYEDHYQADGETADAASGVPQHRYGEVTQPSRVYSLARWSLQFTVVCAIVLLPIQIAVYAQDLTDARDQLMAQSGVALEELRAGKDALQSLRLLSAAEHFQRAQASFESARKDYRRLNFFTKVMLQTVPQGRRSVRAGLTLLSAGESLAQLGREFTDAVASFSAAETWPGMPTVISALDAFQVNLKNILPQVAQARTALASLRMDADTLPNRERFLQVARALPQIEDTLLDTSAVTQSILLALGARQWQRYLVLFQNTNERRATGGFLGSYAIMDVENGAIVNLEVPSQGSYALQGSLLALVAAPPPLQLIKSRWEFQDANWWPDFSLSARKAAWFLEQARGPSVDGVIALDNALVERLLDVTGPIQLPAYGRVIEASNFTLETQKIVEREYDPETNRPKQFLSDLAPRLLERMMQLDPAEQGALLNVLYRGLREKHLLLYSQYPQTQAMLENLDWAGRQPSVGLSDYLMVVQTNIGGGKTDGVVDTSLHHDVRIEPDQTLTVTLTITRTHRGTPGDDFTGQANTSWVRVYVPNGSTLLSAVGFAAPEAEKFEPADPHFARDDDLAVIEGEHRLDADSGMDLYQEQGKTVFAHWITVRPGEQRSAILTYRLPFSFAQLNRTYTLLAQKQPGSLGDEILSTLRLPAGNRILKSYPFLGSGTLQQEGTVVQFHDRLVADKFYGITVGPSSE